MAKKQQYANGTREFGPISPQYYYRRNKTYPHPIKSEKDLYPMAIQEMTITRSCNQYIYIINRQRIKTSTGKLQHWDQKQGQYRIIQAWKTRIYVRKYLDNTNSARKYPYK